MEKEGEGGREGEKDGWVDRSIRSVAAVARRHEGRLVDLDSLLEDASLAGPGQVRQLSGAVRCGVPSPA